MEYRSRTFRIDDEVWGAVQKHELSANQLLRRVLELDKNPITVREVTRPLLERTSLDAVGPELSSGRGKASTEVVRRGPKLKGDKTR